MQQEKTPWQKLDEIRQNAGPRQTEGLPKETILRFLSLDPALIKAINDAHRRFYDLGREFPGGIIKSESELIAELQSGFLNFYGPQSVSPYVPLAGRGPWIITSHGAVVYDAGGYGMLGFGHARRDVREIMSHSMVMANIMTPSFSQHRFIQTLKEKIGFTRKDKEPYSHFLCMNSGSEAVTVAARLSDLHAKIMTDPGGKYAGRLIKFLSLIGSFHGRTDRPAQVSDSSRHYYQVLASFRGLHNLITVAPNDLEGLDRAFKRAEEENVFIEAMFLEPVLGEGNPGLAISPEFYRRARSLTRRHDTLLIVDSVQAGLRCYGCLSIVDYPGFSKLDPPDMETFSKAINAGQYPLSVLAVSAEVAASYKPGIYGNTMTGNPRGLEVARAVLNKVDQNLARNIRERGHEFLEKLGDLKQEFPKAVLNVQGTGLLVSAALEPDHYPVEGPHGVELQMRRCGVNVISGGNNSLRFTPHFNLTSEEINLVVSAARQVLAAFSA